MLGFCEKGTDIPEEALLLVKSTIFAIQKKINMGRIALLFACLFFYVSSQAQDIRKSFYGALDLQGTKLEIVFHIGGEGDHYTTTLDSPAQGAKDIQTDTTYIVGDSITISSATLNMEFKGRIAPAGNQIEGTFSQNGFSFPLKLSDTKIIAPVEELRYQDPRDFPYYSEQFLVPNYIDSVAIAGTLTMPYSADIEHAVILITGSGPQDRNEEIPAINHRPFLVLSDFLTRQGIAVFRYDDRGIGGSSGVYGTATIDNFARDAEAVIDFARSRADLIDAKIGLIGHSEGGMVAPMLADKVDFLVLLAAPGTSTGQLLLSQSRLISEANQVQDTVIDANEMMMKDVYSYLIDNIDQPDSILFTQLKERFIAALDYYPEDVKSSIPDPEAFATQQTAILLTPWFKHFINFTPYDHLSKVTVPVFALNGTLDLQVPYNENLKAIGMALTEAGNENFELVAMDGLNHLFQTAITGAPSEYKKLSETFSEEAMKEIIDWIKKL